MHAAWIGLAWLVTAFLLQHYTVRMNGLLPDGATWREYAVCGGQILWQGVLVGIMAPRKLWDYLGAMMTVSLAGGIALALFGTVLDGFGLQSPWVAAALFASVAGLMLAEHLRRCRVLCLPWTVSAGWVLYRLLLLYIIMKG
ncbi:MAG: hypothetical protein EOP50_17685 [Sphingobacteriales bacterium]|nr:MAG: hypothetical protein EOP50_17685 [Sphingobacteriales bacterium]